MCKVSDLFVLVVDKDDNELRKSCDALKRLGITKMVCANTYLEAVETVQTNMDVDIVLSDYEIEEGQYLGMLLVSFIKKDYPHITVILTSKEYNCSVVLDAHRYADDILDKNRDNDIEDLMGKWITLAQLKNETREILHGTRKSRSAV